VFRRGVQSSQGSSPPATSSKDAFLQFPSGRNLLGRLRPIQPDSPRPPNCAVT
jgi:hypothetical protein